MGWRVVRYEEFTIWGLQPVLAFYSHKQISSIPHEAFLQIWNSKKDFESL